MSACCRHYPGRSERFNRSVLIARRRPSPNFGWVGSCIMVFEACSAFTRVTACRLAKSPMRPSTPEAPAALSPPPPLRLLPGGAIQFPGGSFSPAVDQRLSRRTVKSPLHFYEKVIKVKADVAALHIFSPTSTMLRAVAWRAVKGAVVGRSS